MRTVFGFYNKDWSLSYLVTLLVIPGFLLLSCKKDIPEPEDEIELTNSQALYGLLDTVYFWNNMMPEVDPLDYDNPSDLLNAVRYKELDKWSYVTTKRAIEEYYAESKYVGYGFGSRYGEDGNLYVSFIFEPVDMYEAGVRRGWIIEAVNGKDVEPGYNISADLGANEVGVSNSFRFLRPDSTYLEKSFEKQEVFMNTVLHREVFEHAGRKVGYFVLQGFTSPTRDELDEVFAEFKMEQVDDVILDMRYNGGGQTVTANYLSSYIAGEAVKDKVFTRYMFNSVRAPHKNRDEEFMEVPGGGLGVDRLMVIGTRSTASASEMVINGLLPYMPVITFGDQTYGKPVGAEGWFYGDLAFVPISFKIANADGVADYFDGLDVNFPADDDLSRPFGDKEEASLKAVLDFIESGVAKTPAKSFIPYKQPVEYMGGLRGMIGAH